MTGCSAIPSNYPVSVIADAMSDPPLPGRGISKSYSGSSIKYFRMMVSRLNFPGPAEKRSRNMRR